MPESSERRADPPTGWEWVGRPRGYTRTHGSPEGGRWAQSIFRPQDYAFWNPLAVRGDGSDRWLSIAEAVRRGWLVGPELTEHPTPLSGRTVSCRKCGQPIEGDGFGSPETGWEHPFTCPHLGSRLPEPDGP